MDAEVTLESRMGVALPVATHALPLWHQEQLLEDGVDCAASDSTVACARRKRQRFGIATDSHAGRVYQSDRFIPSRKAMDMEYCSFVIESDDQYDINPTASYSSYSSPSSSVQRSLPVNPSSASATRTCASPSASKDHHMNELDNHVRYKETLAANLLFQSPPRRKKTTLLQFHDSENFYHTPCAAMDSPTSVASHPSLLYLGAHSANIRSRHIPSSPTRILDAPELRDDYYLNLVSWGDNNVLAVALDKVVYLYNTDTGAIQEIKACTGRGDYVTSVAWIRSATTSCTESSTDSNKLAIGTFRSELQVWDTATATKVRSLRGHSDRIGALAWNGSSLSSGSRDAKILHHDLRSLSVSATLQGHQQEICGLAWSPDGKTLASGGNDNCLCLWDAKTFSAGSSSSTLPRQRLLQHRAAVKALAWCPWERHLLASGGGTADRAIKFWNSSSGRMLNSVHTGSQVCGLVWSKTERELLSSHGFSQNELCLWKYPSMVRMREFTGHTARVLHLAMSPDGSSVVSAAADETLRFWNVFASTKNTHKPSLLLSNPRHRSCSVFPGAVIR